MSEFTYTEITAEYERLGYTYPKDTDFTEDEIFDAVENLSSWYLTKTIASFDTENKVKPAQLKAWAAFAETLDGELISEHPGFKVVRNTTDKERREQALTNLKHARYNEQRAEAEQNLSRIMNLR